MWDCPECGCQAIAGDLTFCPQCFAPRNVPAEQEPLEASAAEADQPAEADPEAPQAPGEEMDGWSKP